MKTSFIGLNDVIVAAVLAMHMLVIVAVVMASPLRPEPSRKKKPRRTDGVSSRCSFEEKLTQLLSVASATKT